MVLFHKSTVLPFLFSFCINVEISSNNVDKIFSTSDFEAIFFTLPFILDNVVLNFDLSP
jgi:hypothetical protein